MSMGPIWTVVPEILNSGLPWSCLLLLVGACCYYLLLMFSLLEVGIHPQTVLKFCFNRTNLLFKIRLRMHPIFN